MKAQTKPLEEVIQALPLEIQEEVRDFIEFLLERRSRRPKAQLQLNWRGALRDLREQHTSVELQREALEWWGVEKGPDVPKQYCHPHAREVK